MTYKIICSWCGKDLGTKEADGNGRSKFNITHSICEDCKARVMDELEQDDKEEQNV